MSNSKTALMTIYTLTPTHCGTGRAAGAVDLPIAREKHTELPILPSTTLKGVARDAFERDQSDAAQKVPRLFGPKISAGGVMEEHQAGLLVFCEGKLLAFPARSLNRPFLFATSRLVVERLERDLRTFGFDALAASARLPTVTSQDDRFAWVADPALNGKPLVIEDLVYEGGEVKATSEVGTLAELFASWLPPQEAQTAARLRRSLIVLPDNDFLSLVQRAIPVQARIALTGGKTTDKWINPENNNSETGNLWYEEALPSDCLFAMFITERAQRGRSNASTRPATWDDFWGNRSLVASVQIGGNETVGYGRCWWHPVEQGGAR